MKFSIRKAGIRDAKRIAEINRQNWKHSFRRVYSKERIRKMLEKKSEQNAEKVFLRWSRRSFVFVVVSEKDIVGFVSYRKSGNKTQVLGLYIGRKLHRKGIGSALMKFLEKREKSRTYTVTSASRKETIKFYEKMGYRKFRSVRHKKTGDVDVVMIKRK